MRHLFAAPPIFPHFPPHLRSKTFIIQNLVSLIAGNFGRREEFLDLEKFFLTFFKTLSNLIRCPKFLEKSAPLKNLILKDREMTEEEKEHLASRKEALKKLKETEAKFLEEISKITPGEHYRDPMEAAMGKDRKKQMFDQLEQTQRVIKNLFEEITQLEKKAEK